MGARRKVIRKTHKKRRQKGGNWDAIQNLRAPQRGDAVTSDYYPQWIEEDFIMDPNQGVQDLELPNAGPPLVLPPPLVDRHGGLPMVLGIGALLGGIWMYNKFSNKYKKEKSKSKTHQY